MNRFTCVCLAAVVLLVSGAAMPSAAMPSAASQQPPAPAPKPAEAPPSTAKPPATPATPAVPVQPPAASAPYKYEPAGRRDPFISLLGRGSDPRTSSATRPSGVPGLLISEITVKGIIKDHTGFLAMIQGPDSKTYVIRAGDRVLDGSVKSILTDAVVFSQDVNDPLSLVKQKEIRKSLKSTQEGRG